MSAAYAFSMRLVEDSIQTARREFEAYEAKTESRDLNAIRNLIAARAWASCARKNIEFAEAELPSTSTLKPLRKRAVAKGRP